MSGCEHPAAALYVDKERKVTHCTLCGDVVMEDQFELDPIFARGARPAGGRSGGVSRSLGGGSIRPTRGTVDAPVPVARPTIDAARRNMNVIARDLEISEDIVDIALGIYKVAVSIGAVSGTRNVVLCACLYAVCRRQRTSHVIYDFTEKTGESPQAIISQMKHICEATHTTVPVVDPSLLVQRFAEEMDLGERKADVIVCALKVLRSMRDDWISCGRRPLGVCAAALLVACYLFGIPRSPEQVCGMVRLTANTITCRLNEFAKTPTANLENIDDYRQCSETLPPAFNDTSCLATEEDLRADMRQLSAVYYELVAEAKTSAPATPERCAKWRTFIEQHCKLESIVPSEENLDLTQLSPKAQLHILGLPHTTPITHDMVESSVKREEEKMLIKRDDSYSSSVPLPPQAPMSSGPYAMPPFGVVDADHRVLTSASQSTVPREPPPASAADALRSAAQDFVGPSSPSARAETDGFNFDDPEQLRQLTTHYTELLGNDEVRGLREDFDFAEEVAGSGEMPLLFGEPTQNTMATPLSATGWQQSPAPELPQSNDGSTSTRAAVEALLMDKERRHALPWEFVILQRPELDDATDIMPYLVLSNEERLRRGKVGKALYKEKWDRGQARSVEDIALLEESRTRKRQRRQAIMKPTSVSGALEHALRGRGAGTVDVSGIEELIPGLVDDDIGDEMYYDDF